MQIAIMKEVFINWKLDRGWKNVAEMETGPMRVLIN